MYVESIKFKREQNSEWESGYYVGEFYNAEKSVFLDCDYQPLGKACRVWDYCSNTENWIQINIPERYKED